MPEIEVGQRFRKVSGPPNAWEVVGVVIGSEGMRHYRLDNVADPSKSILISERALLNSRYFRAVDAQRPRRQ
jgi:hypothetical protein